LELAYSFANLFVATAAVKVNLQDYSGDLL